MTPRTPAKYCARLQSTAAQRSRHCQVWRWLSTKPGMTIMSVPSMMLASTGPIPGFTSGPTRLVESIDGFAVERDLRCLDEGCQLVEAGRAGDRRCDARSGEQP